MTTKTIPMLPANRPVDQIAKLLQALFIIRDDLYARQVQRGTNWIYTPVKEPLTDKVLQAHLAGRITIGIYPDRQKTKWLCIDVDSRDPAEIREVIAAARKIGIDPAIEDSGSKGYHLWTFFERPIAHHLARRIGKELTQKHEIFPKQDAVPAGGFGNLLKLPLGIHRATGKRCLFLDENLIPLADQYEFLTDVNRYFGEALVERIVQSSSVPVKPARAPAKVTRNHSPAPDQLKPCIKRLLAAGAKCGRRNVIGHAIACEFRRVGLNQLEARGALRTWNLRNSPPLGPQEIQAILRSAYTREYEYGCGKNGLLQALPECSGPRNCTYYQKFIWQGKDKNDLRIKSQPKGGNREQPQKIHDGRR